MITTLAQFFRTGQTQSIAFRRAQLVALKKSIISHQEMLIHALQQDLGKAPFESYISEIHLILQEIDHTLANLHIWSRPQRVSTSFLLFPSKGSIVPEPRGVVLIIGAWNYPLQLILIPLIGAIAAGNCAVLKPSEHAPQCSRLIAQIIATLFPTNYITVIEGDAATGQALLQHAFDYIFFTGSTRVGKIVMQEAAKHLTPLTLELGGKNPCIVTEHVDLDCAAKRIVWGKFYNAGQNCISPDYVLCASEIKDVLIQKLIFWITQFYGKNPQTSPDYARIINAKHLERLEQLLAHTHIAFGGAIDKKQRYIAPTILDNINLQAPIMQEEIFGPLLPIITYQSLDQAITFINDRPHPLALYLFSNKTQEQQQFIRNTQSGGICINDTLIQAYAHDLPFGGVGKSGFGAYHGKKTFDTFTHYKSVVKNKCWFDLSVRYPPYGKKHIWFQKLLSFFNK
jgi:acyl-CoA reductase-like NAD-dependent aldehyde dehydrogenase